MARTREETDEKVREIETMMRSGQWIRGVSAQLMAKKLGCSLSTVERWARIASVRVWSDDDAEDRRQLKAETIGRLSSISLKAEGNKQFNAATSALRAANEIAGNIQSQPTVNLYLGGDGQLRGPLALIMTAIAGAIEHDGARVVAALESSTDAVVSAAGRGLRAVLGPRAHEPEAPDSDAAALVDAIDGTIEERRALLLAAVAECDARDLDAAC